MQTGSESEGDEDESSSASGSDDDMQDSEESQPAAIANGSSEVPRQAAQAPQMDADGFEVVQPRRRNRPQAPS